MSKGSKVRPMHVSYEEFKDNWDLAFKKYPEFAELSIVKLKDTIEVENTENLPRLKKGLKGAIVDIYKNGEVFEVEFFDEKGNTLTVATVPKDLLEQVV